jgi:LruC domain-containing protein
MRAISNSTRFMLLIFVVVTMAGTQSCKKNTTTNPDPNTETGINALTITENFNWSTSESVSWKVSTFDNSGEPLAGVKVGIYTKDPIEEGKLIVSGITNKNGVYEIDYKVPGYYDSVFVQTDYIGIISPGMVDISSGGFELSLGGNNPPILFKGSAIMKNQNTNYGYLGSYNNLGVPGYLEPVNDVISQALLNDINNTLPERSTLYESHPEYLKPEYDYNLHLIEDCDVWITFVHEGAGYRNVLGFYTYQTGEAPQTPGDIDQITVIYPNVSYAGSGGGLHSGNKVHIGQYEAGTTISFALMANGWRNRQVTDGNWIVYSNPNLNPESDPELRQHTVLLNDNGRNLLLLGIEDILRDRGGCDHDFNDAVFLVSANPVEAIDQSGFPNIDYTGQDSDGDDVPDHVDDYPDDAEKAFDNFFFNEGNFGTLAFEDMWPNVGDYDFNDAVIDYNFNQITDSENKLVEILGIFKLKAHGAYFHNGFGIQLPFDKSYIESVSGDIFTNNGIVTLDSKNLETGQDLPVIIIWDDAYDVLPQSGGGVGVNTTPGIEYVEPDILNITIKLNQPVALSETGIPPYNPFIFVDGQRNVEIHLIDKAPTDLADKSLFGNDADNSNPDAGKYYRTDKNLPWAINIIEEFEYPVEKSDVTSAYLKFGEWAESDGTTHKDWWKDKTCYRNYGNIYQIPE